jgi:hypothetical protein
LDHLLELFYAFARSESAKAFPPEKEDEYKQKVTDLETQIKNLRDKVVS